MGLEEKEESEKKQDSLMRYTILIITGLVAMSDYYC